MNAAYLRSARTILEALDTPATEIAKKLPSRIRATGLAATIAYLSVDRETAAGAAKATVLHRLADHDPRLRSLSSLPVQDQLDLTRQVLQLSNALRLIAHAPNLHQKPRGAAAGYRFDDSNVRTWVSTRSASGGLPDGNPGLLLRRLAPALTATRDAAAFARSLAKLDAPESYARAFKRWQQRTPNDTPTRRVLRLEAEGLVLVGHAQESPLENGLALLPPYGLPYLPGSALKGVTSAYAASLGGSWCREDGEDHRDLFGVGGDDGRAGCVDFLDGWWCPEGKPFALDVLTPHYSNYYRGTEAPTGHEDPNPVHFVAARGSFRIVLEGPTEWLDAAQRLLVDTLRWRGIGAKTRAGYGRLIHRTLDKVDLASEDRRDRLRFLSQSGPERLIELTSADPTLMAPGGLLERFLMGADTPLEDNLDRSDLRTRQAIAGRLRAVYRSKRSRLRKSPGKKKQALEAFVVAWESWSESALSTGRSSPEAPSSGTPSTGGPVPNGLLRLTKPATASDKKRLKALHQIADRAKRAHLHAAAAGEVLRFLEENGAKPGTIADLRRHYRIEP